jgi:hypothetical protein
MTDQLKFFSEEWCTAAAAAHEGDLARRQAKALKDPANFDRVLAFGVTDRPDLVTHVEIVAGKVVNWTATDFYPDDRIFASFRGSAADFREAAEGRTPAANLVMGGKVRLVKGTMKDAIENAKALNVLIGAWGDLPTDWDV